jgi:rhodanese-related sulfurtransferase
VRRISRITAPALRDLLEPAAPPVVDVRFEREWREEAIPGSVNIPLDQLRRRTAEIPADRPVVVYCHTGQRSSTAASLLAQAGYTQVLDLVGGFAAWKVSSGQGVPHHV